MTKDWKKELEEYLARAAKKQHVSDNKIIANNSKASDPTYRKNLSKGKKGKKRIDMMGDNNPTKNPKVAKKISEYWAGVPKSREQVTKFKESYKQLPILTCPHCNMQGINQGNLNRYHFDNCNMNPKSPRFIADPRVVKQRAKQPKITCPHCKKTGGTNAMKRLHFDNCKFK